MKETRLIAATLVAVVFFCGCKKSSSRPERFAGDGFSIPIPDGYSPAPPDVLAEMREGNKMARAALFAQKEGTTFRPSIVVSEVASTDIHPESGKPCEESAEPLAAATGSKVVVASKLVDYPFGKTCQLEVSDGKQYAIGTVAYIDKRFWMVICNADPSELERRRRECEAVLRGFKE